MTKAQAKALIAVQLASNVMSITLRVGDADGEWFARILMRDRECNTVNFPEALLMLADAIRSRTP